MVPEGISIMVGKAWYQATGTKAELSHLNRTQETHIHTPGPVGEEKN